MKPAEQLVRIDEAAAFLKKRYPHAIGLAFILGSGLGDFETQLENRVEIPYSDIPFFPVSSVIGHSGKLIFGELSRRHLAVLSGRVHYYEACRMNEIIFPTRVLGRMGVEKLVITNAAGAINSHFEPADLMFLTDHINLLGSNPLQGQNIDELGVRFPDMSEAYSIGFRELAQRAAVAIGLQVHTGIYLATTGPSYETPAEIQMFERMGADAVGMSTVPEVIAANHMGMQVLGISCITNMAAGVVPLKLDHEDVLEITTRVQKEFIGLLKEIVRQVAEEGGCGDT